MLDFQLWSNVVCVCIILRLDLNMELPQGQTGSVGTSVASAEQVPWDICKFDKVKSVNILTSTEDTL